MVSISSIAHRSVHAIPEQDLPIPVTCGLPGTRPTQLNSPDAMVEKIDGREYAERMVLDPEDEKYLMPAYMPPKSGFWDAFLFPTLVEFLVSCGKMMNGRRAARIQARMIGQRSHNLPLEISLYIVCLLFPVFLALLLLFIHPELLEFIYLRVTDA